MPIDLDMLLSAANHPLFSYSPFSDTRYDRFSVASDYSKNDLNGNLSRQHFLLRSNSKQLNFIQNKPLFNTYADNENLKSKLVSEHVVDSSQQRKKKVSFADDRGLSLVEVRVIPETAGNTPKWADDVLSLLIGDAKPNVVQDKSWKLAADHLPWSDEKLIKLLEINSIAVESVTVDEGVLSGVIKVQNLGFEKAVFLRVSFDRWVSYVDVNAFHTACKNSKTSSLYDAFAFKMTVPQSAGRYDVIEFCAGFKCCDQEYWDNNGGINYRLVAVADAPKESLTSELSTPKVTFSVTANFDDYSGFDSWNRFMYDRPYW